ncbi:hypothetical protein KIPB_006480 [Kipferlia bialata]|uniref:Uncharacterized protein n=1 Tax=Kipferlia bialata TaxID=797122 RepID=A0A9K3GJ51_9EUKA|nr:hypothetical protein KIPB_006480 [Kipferlia bialata]|eukprot:g6480.t1
MQGGPPLHKPVGAPQSVPSAPPLSVSESDSSGSGATANSTPGSSQSGLGVSPDTEMVVVKLETPSVGSKVTLVDPAPSVYLPPSSPNATVVNAGPSLPTPAPGRPQLSSHATSASPAPDSATGDSGSMTTDPSAKEEAPPVPKEAGPLPPPATQGQGQTGTPPDALELARVGNEVRRQRAPPGQVDVCIELRPSQRRLARRYHIFVPSDQLSPQYLMKSLSDQFPMELAGVSYTLGAVYFRQFFSLMMIHTR